MRFVIFAITALVLGGCALMNRPSAEQIAKADYGPIPSDYQATIKQYMDDVLKDPASAVYSDWRGPSQGYVSNMNGAFFGYRVCVMVNAKNSYGGYTGKQPHTFVIKNDSVIQYKGGGISGTMGLEESYNLCNSIPVMSTVMPKRLVLGLTFLIVTSDGSVIDTATKSVGAEILSITAGSPAEKAGLLVGDVITKIGTTDIRQREHIRQSISTMHEGDSIAVAVLRDSKPLELNLTF